MDMEGEDCFAVPIPQITSSGGKSFNQSGVVVGPVVVEVAGDDPHAVTIRIRDSTKRIEEIFFITNSLSNLKEHTFFIYNISLT
jgi:hypothetical protein